MKIKIKAKSFGEAIVKCPWATSISSTKGGYICSNEKK